MSHGLLPVGKKTKGELIPIAEVLPGNSSSCFAI